MTTVVALPVAALCAYALARLRFRGRGLLLALILAVSMFPQISIVPPLYLMLRELRLLDTYPASSFPYVTFSAPLAVWLLTGFFRQLSPELEEAAMLDGASRVRALWDVVLPLAAPGVATAAILTFLYCWNEFLFALSFTLGPDRYTVPVAVTLFRGRYQVPWGQVLAATVVATIAGRASGADLPAADRRRPDGGREQRLNAWPPFGSSRREDLPERTHRRSGMSTSASAMESSWCWWGHRDAARARCCG